MSQKVKELESSDSCLSKEQAQELLSARASLKDLEMLKAKELNLFLKGWWAEKEDRPVKELFRKLKKKHELDFVPLLMKEDGSKARSQPENLDIAVHYFQKVFHQPG